MGAKRTAKILLAALFLSTLPLAAAPFAKCRECVRLDSSSGAHECREWRDFDCSAPDLGPDELEEPCLSATVTATSRRVTASNGHVPTRASTGTNRLTLIVPEGGAYAGRYSSFGRVVIDLPDDVPPGEHDMRFGPTPIPSCPPCPDPEPEGELVRISDTRCLPSSPGVRAWEGTVTTQAPAPRVEGLWRCAVEVPDPDQPGRCGEDKR